MQTVKLDDVLRGRKLDITMQPDDIVFYSTEHPQSGRKDCFDGRRRIRYAGVFLYAVKRFLHNPCSAKSPW